MRTIVVLILAVILLLSVTAAFADDILAYLVETTGARITCGSYWLDYMPYDRWALGQGDTALAIDWGPYHLAEKMLNLCGSNDR